MKRYIRTKNGIFRRYKNSEIIDNIFYYPDNGVLPEYRRELILKQANTIEELCDEFVAFHKTLKLTYCIKKTPFEEQDENFNIYGAIWTDKGLIYAAKMNEQGELELL